MIRRVSLTNYGPFASVDLELAPLTVVVGPNASGKSKLLEMLHLFGSSIRGNTSRPNEFLPRMRRKGSKEQLKVEFESSDGSRTVWRTGTGSSGVSVSTEKSWRSLPHIFILRLEPDTLRSPSYIDSDEPYIREDGYGLATTLVYLKLNDIDTFNRLLKQTRDIVPTFEDLRFKRARVSQSNGGEVYGDDLIFDMKSAPDLTPDNISDGTLLTLGLLTCTMEYTRRHKAESAHLLFLIDDVERGLHPRALAELVAQLRRLTETTGAQILATSHSPDLLDALKPEEVRLTGFLEDGSATIKALSEHPDFDRWKDEMTPGEIWSMVGEDWIR